MSAYELDLVNGALGRIGVARIASIDGTDSVSSWAKTLLPQTRRHCLGLDWWSFAEKRVTLAKDAVNTPNFEFSSQYPLPSDLIRLKVYNGANIDLSAVDPIYQSQLLSRYKIEGQNIFTNDGEVKIVYTYDEDNPQRWLSQFFQLVKVWLASELASAVLKNEDKASSLLNEALTVHLPLASAIDSQQRGTPERYQVNDLIWGRG